MNLYMCIHLPATMSGSKGPFSLVSCLIYFPQHLGHIHCISQRFSLERLNVSWCCDSCPWVIKKSEKTHKTLEILLKQESGKLQISACVSNGGSNSLKPFIIEKDWWGYNWNNSLHWFSEHHNINVGG